MSFLLQGFVHHWWQRDPEADHNEWLTCGEVSWWSLATGSSIQVYWRTWRRWGRHCILAPFFAYCNMYNLQAQVVWSMDNTIHWINLYPMNNTVHFVNTYLLDSDLSIGENYCILYNLQHLLWLELSYSDFITLELPRSDCYFSSLGTRHFLESYVFFSWPWLFKGWITLSSGYIFKH